MFMELDVTDTQNIRSESDYDPDAFRSGSPYYMAATPGYIPTTPDAMPPTPEYVYSAYSGPIGGDNLTPEAILRPEAFTPEAIYTAAFTPRAMFFDVVTSEASFTRARTPQANYDDAAASGAHDGKFVISETLADADTSEDIYSEADTPEFIMLEPELQATIAILRAAGGHDTAPSQADSSEALLLEAVNPEVDPTSRNKSAYPQAVSNEDFESKSMNPKPSPIAIRGPAFVPLRPVTPQTNHKSCPLVHQRRRSSRVLQPVSYASNEFKILSPVPSHKEMILHSRSRSENVTETSLSSTPRVRKRGARLSNPSPRVMRTPATVNSSLPARTPKTIATGPGLITKEEVIQGFHRGLRSLQNFRMRFATALCYRPNKPVLNAILKKIANEVSIGEFELKEEYNSLVAAPQSEMTLDIIGAMGKAIKSDVAASKSLVCEKEMSETAVPISFVTFGSNLVSSRGEEAFDIIQASTLLSSFVKDSQGLGTHPAVHTIGAPVIEADRTLKPAPTMWSAKLKKPVKLITQQEVIDLLRVHRLSAFELSSHFEIRLKRSARNRALLTSIVQNVGWMFNGKILLKHGF